MTDTHAATGDSAGCQALASPRLQESEPGKYYQTNRRQAGKTLLDLLEMDPKLGEAIIFSMCGRRCPNPAFKVAAANPAVLWLKLEISQRRSWKRSIPKKCRAVVSTTPTPD
jgi:hypothetical protein